MWTTLLLGACVASATGLRAPPANAPCMRTRSAPMRMAEPGDVVCDDDGCMLMLDTEDDGKVDSAIKVEDALPLQGAAQSLILQPLFEVLSVACTLALSATFVVAYGELTPEMRSAVDGTDIVCSTFFVFEFVARWWAVGLSRRHLFKPLTLLDLLNVLPVLVSPGLPFLPSTPLAPSDAASLGGTALAPLAPLRLLRTARILRLRRLLQPEELARLVRFVTGDAEAEVAESTRLALRLAFSALSIVVVSAGLEWEFERAANPTLDGFLDAVYMSFNIITTVGLGDVVPTTDAGRLVVVLEQVAAVTVIPLEIAALSGALRGGSRQADAPAGGRRDDLRCERCLLRGHEADARFCRACGAPLEGPPQDSAAAGADRAPACP